MKISQPFVKREGSMVKLQSRVEYQQGQFDLWFAVDQQYEPWLSHENLDSFLMGIFLVAMKHGEDIYLEGPVSEKLYYNMTHGLIHIFSLLDPSFKEVSVYPGKLNPASLNPDNRNNVVTGFSGGIDSFHLLANHFFNEPPASYRVTHLVYNNVGAHGNHASDFFHKRFNRLVDFSREMELPFVKIDSNLYEILDTDFLLSVLPRNVASVLALQKLFGKYLYASSYTFRDFLEHILYRIGYLDPLSISLLATETMEPVLVGSHITRVEKTRQVTDVESSHHHLYVCTETDRDTAENCSTCFKCSRTLLTLEILGKLHQYDQVFDLDKYQKIKQPYIDSLLYYRDPFAREILDLADARGYAISPMNRFRGSKPVYPLLEYMRKHTPESFRQNIKRFMGMKVQTGSS